MRSWLLICLLCACDAASNDPGTEAFVQIPGAQFVEGELPADAGGPAVVAAAASHNQVEPGGRGERISGALAEDANALAVGLPGDVGFWVVTAKLPDVQVPDLPTFDLRVDFAQDLPRGPFELVLLASDRAAVFGPATRLPLVAADTPPPEGELVVALSWDTDADLDLRVVTPDGIEIWARNPSSYEPPPPGGIPADPNAWRSGAYLDADSNSRCTIDGRNAENVIWPVPPLSGHYVVRVDTFSLCDAAFASWYVVVYRAGAPVASARGMSVASDTRGSHGAGAGATALELDLE